MGLREKFEEAKKQKSVVMQSHTTEISAYTEHDDSIELDAIERLKSNIMMLDDLQKRLRFMNDELEHVIGSRKIS